VGGEQEYVLALKEHGPVVAVAITADEAAALARATTGLAKVWRLTDHEACGLLGGIAAITWSEWKLGKIGTVPDDARGRMAHLIGIHRNLRLVFADPDRGYAWIRAANADFGGRSALEFLLDGDISAFVSLRNQLDPERIA
jgi:hypothetical protein